MKPCNKGASSTCINNTKFYAIAKDLNIHWIGDANNPKGAMIQMIKQVFDNCVEDIGYSSSHLNRLVGQTLGNISDYEVFDLNVDQNTFMFLAEGDCSYDEISQHMHEIDE